MLLVSCLFDFLFHFFIVFYFKGEILYNSFIMEEKCAMYRLYWGGTVRFGGLKFKSSGAHRQLEAKI